MCLERGAALRMLALTAGGRQPEEMGVPVTGWGDSSMSCMRAMRVLTRHSRWVALRTISGVRSAAWEVSRPIQ